MAATGFRAPFRFVRGWGTLAVALALVATPAVAAGSGSVPSAGWPRDTARTTVTSPHEITETGVGRFLARAASGRLSDIGSPVRPRDLVVWRDAAGVLVAPRDTRLKEMRWHGRHAAKELVPELSAGALRTGLLPRIGAAADESPPAAWTMVASGCYERISDTWSWLDHCARIYRLSGDSDSAHDTYALQRVATAGPNPPWVLKSASISATPIDAALMSWTDWSPRNDRSGVCQPFVVSVVAPLAGLPVSVDRCESWDITKGAHGGDFRLDWFGCTCTHDRALAFDVVVSVPQGRNPGWYVPADVHGFPF